MKAPTPQQEIPQPLTGGAIKAKRIQAGIAGYLVCTKLNRSRGWLCSIEREYTVPTADELNSIDAALNDLIRAKAVIAKTAAALGWPAREVR